MKDIEKIKEELIKKREEEKKNWRKRWEEMKPFTRPDDIPDIPILSSHKEYEEVVVKNLIRCGAIPLDQLEIGATYIGSCRNSTEAVWEGMRFHYQRYKFGEWQEDWINHFQDDNGYDLFVPIKKKESGD